MHLLVTGGAGFIGSTLVDRALAEDCTVDVVDNLSTGSLINLADSRAEAASRSTGQGALKIHQADILADGFDDLVARRRPDVIVHLAGDTVRAGRTPRRQVSTDLLGVLAVLDAARVAGVPRIVWVAAARAQADPVRGIPDRAAIEYLRIARDAGSIDFCALVLPTIYGPRQHPGTESSVVATFVHRMVAEQQCVVHGDGTQARDLLHVDDCVDALVRATTAGSGDIVELASGAPVTIADLHERVARVVGHELAAAFGPARDGEPGSVPVDAGDAERVLGWRPFTTLDEGLARTVAAARI